MMAAISIIVPTHNRRDAVLRLLHALERQAPIDGGFEAIVVADGCTDGTALAISGAAWAFPVAVVDQPSAGPAAARNAGAARASGDLLLFLDDDVEPLSDLLRAHARFHDRCARGVGIGDLPPAVEACGYYGTILRGWWLDMYEGPRERGHRYIYRNLLSGHFSIRRSWFDAIGRFDCAFRCHEDWELGYRAIDAGLSLQFLPDAIARHHEVATLSKTLRRKFDDGVADVQLIERYPALVADLPLGCPREGGRVARLLRRLAWVSPAAGAAAARGLQSLLHVYEAAHLRFRWRARLEDLLDYAYWRGVASAAGSRDRLRALIARAPRPQPPELTIDLARGIDAAKAELDAARPRSVRITVAGGRVGDVAAEPGAERLRGEHLPRIIARRFALQYLRAAAAAGIVPATLRACAPPAHAPATQIGAAEEAPAVLAPSSL